MRALMLVVLLLTGCAKPRVLPEMHKDCVPVVVGTVGPDGVFERPAWLCSRDALKAKAT